MTRGKAKKRHFVFDVDDTLTDSYEFNQQMFVDTFKPYLNVEQPSTDKFLRELHYTSKGTSMTDQFRTAIEYFSLKVTPQELVEQNEEIHRQNAGQIRIFEAVEELIRTITDTGLKVSICTNRQTESLLRILDSNGLQKYFSHIVSCSDAGHEKPDPYCLLDLVSKSGDPKESFIYFGDSKTDYQFATGAGIDFIIIDHYLNEKKFYKMIVEAFI